MLFLEKASQRTCDSATGASSACAELIAHDRSTRSLRNLYALQTVAIPGFPHGDGIALLIEEQYDLSYMGKHLYPPGLHAGRSCFMVTLRKMSLKYNVSQEKTVQTAKKCPHSKDGRSLFPMAQAKRSYP